MSTTDGVNRLIADERNIADQQALAAANERIANSERRNVEYAEQVRHLSNLLSEQDEATRTAREQHALDIRFIGERLIDEAQRRDWCGEYDDVVNDLNRSLHVPLPDRFVNYDVERVYQVIVRDTTRGARDDEESIAENHEQTISNRTLAQMLQSGEAMLDNDGAPTSVNVTTQDDE